MTEQTPARRFAWSNMFVAPEDDPRGQEGYHGEREVLAGYLRDYRLTLKLKCEGLDAQQMAQRSVPPSTMSLLGLVRHLAGVEHNWFRIRMAGQDVPRLYRGDADFEGAVGDAECVREAWQTWQREVDFAEHYVDEAAGMGVVGVAGDELRDVLVHMIEEYARHMGHADFLRERIDGRVGQ